MEPFRKFTAKFSASCVLAAALAGSAYTGGCTKNNDQGGGPAAPGGGGKTGHTYGVVDLESVANTVGWVDERKTELNATAADNQVQIKAYFDSVNKVVTGKKDAVAKAANLKGATLDDFMNGRNVETWQKLLSKEQLQDLGWCFSVAQQEQQKAVQEYNAAQQRRAVTINTTYRKVAEPAIRHVAEANGISAVGSPETLFYFDPAVDLTRKVVDELQVTKPPHALPARERLNLPPEFTIPPFPTAATPPAVPPPTTRSGG